MPRPSKLFESGPKYIKFFMDQNGFSCTPKAYSDSKVDQKAYPFIESKMWVRFLNQENEQKWSQTRWLSGRKDEFLS